MSDLRHPFWRPDTDVPNSPTDDRTLRGELRNPDRASSAYDSCAALPILNQKLSILYTLEEYRTIIVVGETESGKTTEIPRYLCDCGWCSDGRAIAVAEPRRIAAIESAKRLSEGRGMSPEDIGKEVGYTVRFDARESCDTRILYATNGALLEMILIDPLLTRFSVVMVDEIHERSVEVDLLLGMLRKIQQRRGDLRVILASRTMDISEVKDLFCVVAKQVIEVDGRAFPVDIHYTHEPVDDYMDEALSVVRDIHAEWRKDPVGTGDILVFVPGSDEVEALCSRLDFTSRSELEGRVLALPLYASLSRSRQLEAVRPTSGQIQRIVVATNIAEASVTVGGIGRVIDCGFEKAKIYKPSANASSLATIPISQSSAFQRASRAGRTQQGKCFRLYTRKYFRGSMAFRNPPEILLSDLAPVVLTLKAAGIEDIANFQFPSEPSLIGFAYAYHRLHALGAVSKDGRLTDKIGKRLAELPLEPELGRMLLAGEDLGVGIQVAKICAMIKVKSILYTISERDRTSLNKSRAPFAVAEGDLLTLLNIFEGYQSVQRSARWCQTHKLNTGALKQADKIFLLLRRFLTTRRIRVLYAADAVRRAIANGLFSSAAVVQPDGTYRTVIGNMACSIHPFSVLYGRFPRWIVSWDLTSTTQLYAREVTVIDPLWLAEDFPRLFEHSDSELNLELDDSGNAGRRHSS